MIMRNIALFSILLFIFLVVQSKHARESGAMMTTVAGKIQVAALGLFLLIWMVLVIHVLVKG